MVMLGPQDSLPSINGPISSRVPLRSEFPFAVHGDTRPGPRVSDVDILGALLPRRAGSPRTLGKALTLPCSPSVCWALATLRSRAWSQGSEGTPSLPRETPAAGASRGEAGLQGLGLDWLVGVKSLPAVL